MSTMQKSGKIKDRTMLEMLERGLKQTEIAKRFGVSRQAVSKRLIELRGKTTKVIVAKKVEQIVDRKIDTMAQLQKINDHANELLDLLMRWNRGDEEALQILEHQVKRVRVGGEEDFVKKFKIKDPRELSVKVMAEIRAQLKLQLEIFQCLFDMKAVQEFQDEVLNAISEVNPDVRNMEVSSRVFSCIFV